MTRDSEDASPEKQPVSEAEILAQIEDMEKKIRHLKQLTLLRREERDKSVEGLTPVLLKVLQNVGRWPITGVRLDRSSPTKAKKRSPSKTISLREKEAQNLKELHDRRKEKPIVINKGLLEQAEKLQNDLQSHNVQRKSTIVGKEWGQLKNAPQTPPTASTATASTEARDGAIEAAPATLSESNGTVDVDTYVTKTPGYKGKSVRESVRFAFKVAEQKQTQLVFEGTPRKVTKNVATTLSSTNHVKPFPGNQNAVSLKQAAKYQEVATRWKSLNTTVFTAVSREEDLMRVFMLLDKDHDGSLTLEEIVAGASRLGLTKDEARALFFKIDLDGSGDVSTEEFSRAFKREMPLDEKHVGQAPDWIKEMDSTTLFTFYKGLSPNKFMREKKSWIDTS